MSSSLLAVAVFVAANGLFLLALRAVRCLPGERARSRAREAVLWLTMALQVAAALRGVPFFPNDAPWIGLLDDASCALSGAWLGVLAAREHRIRNRPPALAGGGARC